MAISDINLGSSPNDGNGTSLRSGGAIINSILEMWNTISGGIEYTAGSVKISTVQPIIILNDTTPSASPYLVANGDAFYINFNTASMTGAPFIVDDDGGIKMPELKTGATQVASTAVLGELWSTSGHATLPDNVIMIGV